jgi:hypothetical protein
VTTFSFRIKATLVTVLLLATVLNYMDRQTIQFLLLIHPVSVRCWAGAGSI